ncbi:MAG: isoleucine--tRNA ligase, partial [Thermoplasmata archaeon]
MPEYSPKIEEEILEYWEKNGIFKKSLEKRKDGKKFIFLEGPPTANGLPHPGHVLTRTMKDVILRYKTMQGYYIERKAGWDTHGLPVEIEVEKMLGLKNKQEVEKYGIERFNEECRKSVFKYEEAWKRMTKRVGFWIDMEHPYITMENSYIESVWWSLKEAWKQGLLYRGYRVTPYCPRCGTTLSSHEVAQGYREVEDPSIFVRFKIKGKDEYFLAWTTTPWTLISNVALAVHPEEDYVKINYNGNKFILAKKRADVLLKDYDIIDEFKGKELEGTEYEPLYDYVKPDKKCWYVVVADFVTMEEGTGIVHIAPAFGEDDYEVGKKYDLPMIQPVDLQGRFTDIVKKWAGMFVKDADKGIIEDLKQRGLLEGYQKYKHQYPFCWRCDTPLLYYAIESWFIGMSKLRENLVKNNEKINWYPNYIKHGR